MELMIVLGVFALMGLLIIWSTFAWGWVLFKFWGWFLMPVFPMLPEVTLVQCMGLMLVIGLFKGAATYIKDEYKDQTHQWVALIINPWLTLLIGWMIYSMFMI